ncbi:hypothetical protein C2G38_2167684 [Gigaspora rosea]|uniref:MULE transposase domain-containing protein n=1 Tax=Gigaspora rosea TaxID=44941 RepID=A0A397VS38_9GLOM|nr:hypothetical protein C2G38_2167684 [Gigaspora rosea]
MQFFDPFESEKNEDQENLNSLEFEFSCSINISELEGDSKEQTNSIIEIISDIDKYKWIYHLKYSSKKSNSTTYVYYCSQRNCLAEKPKKHVDINKCRYRQPIKRFFCKGQVTITISQDFTCANVEIYHKLHPPRLDNSISSEIKQYILENIDLLPREIYKRLVDNLNLNIHQKQIHFWWTELGNKRYKRDKNPFISTQKWLMEELHQIIIQKESPQAISFLTGMWNILRVLTSKSMKLELISHVNIVMDYNTNNLRFELFVVHAHVDGSGYPLAYLFLENNGNCNNGIRTAARFVWKNIKVQICLWHIKRAIENRLSNNVKPKQINYNSQMAHDQFNFSDVEFCPQLDETTYIFCPKQFRKAVWEMMNQHLHLHPLIPTNNGQYLTVKRNLDNGSARNL